MSFIARKSVKIHILMTLRLFQTNPQHTASQPDNLPNSYTQNSSFFCTAAFSAQSASYSPNKQALIAPNEQAWSFLNVYKLEGNTCGIDTREIKYHYAP
jgi:hypothetical protein